MRILTSLSLVSLLAVGTLEAQVQGAIVLGGGPVSGAVIFGDGGRRDYRAYDRGPRVVVVEDWRGPRGRARGWWKRDGFREVVIYRDRDRFYDRFDRGRRGLTQVVVYERGGHYYDARWFDDRYVDRRWDDRRWDDRRWDNRRNDRWDDRRGNRRDDRWDDRRDDRWDDRRDDRRDRRDRRDD